MQISTIFDTIAMAFLVLAETALGVVRSAIRLVLAPKSGGPVRERFVPFRQRAWFTALPMSWQFYRRVQESKGRLGGPGGAMHWKGIAMLKDPFELALYPLLLWELRPATIIEIGSYTGASAAWLADLLAGMGVEGHVYSFDIDRAQIVARHERVTFEFADCSDPSTFPAALLQTLPHPWLVIEDAHRNLYDLLCHFDQFLVPGDYLAVEDLLSPRLYSSFRRFALECESRYRVDTHYTDLYGYNATWNLNAYLKRV